MSLDETLRRRDFLARTAAAAGIGASAAAALSPEVLIAEAAKKSARRAGQEDEQRHHDEMGELEVLADRFGVAVGQSKPSDLFRAPDSVRRAVRENPA